MKWKYLIIIMALLLIPIVYGVAEDMCEEVILPNTTCQMNTPVIDCSNFTFNIINKTGSVVTTGNLTLLNDSIYFFNFTEDVGEYVVELCSGSTTQVFVERREDNMLPITIGVILVIVIFILIGVFSSSPGIKFLGYGVALIELILLLFLLYARESAVSLIPLLRMNYQIMLILGFGIGFIAAVRLAIRLMNPNDEIHNINDNMNENEYNNNHEDRPKWRGR